MTAITRFEVLSGSRLITLADVDNLSISSKIIHRRKFDQGAFRQKLAAVTKKLTATAVLTTHRGLNYTTEAWRRAGWKVTAVMREMVHTHRGEEFLANADIDLAFEAGILVAAHPHADTLLICTGDGTLSCSIARDVKRWRPTMAIYAAAIPGTASRRLRDDPVFDGFLDLGMDCTEEI